MWSEKIFMSENGKILSLRFDQIENKQWKLWKIYRDDCEGFSENFMKNLINYSGNKFLQIFNELVHVDKMFPNGKYPRWTGSLSLNLLASQVIKIFHYLEIYFFNLNRNAFDSGLNVRKWKPQLRLHQATRLSQKTQLKLKVDIAFVG